MHTQRCCIVNNSVEPCRLCEAAALILCLCHCYSLYQAEITSLYNSNVIILCFILCYHNFYLFTYVLPIYTEILLHFEKLPHYPRYTASSVPTHRVGWITSHKPLGDTWWLRRSCPPQTDFASITQMLAVKATRKMDSVFSSCCKTCGARTSLWRPERLSWTASWGSSYVLRGCPVLFEDSGLICRLNLFRALAGRTDQGSDAASPPVGLQSQRVTGESSRTASASDSEGRTTELVSASGSTGWLMITNQSL